MMHFTHHRKKSFSGVTIGEGGGGLDGLGGLGGEHQDCNGKTPVSQLLQLPPRHQTEHSRGENSQNQMIADVFPQVNARNKDREDLDDEIDYVG